MLQPIHSLLATSSNGLYAEEYPTIQEAILREKQLKNWHRNWKINLIEKSNATWQDLLDPETSSG